MPDDRSSRRAYLATLATALSAGCLGDGLPVGDPGTPSATPWPGGTVQPRPDAENTLVDYDVSVDREATEWDRYDADWAAPTTDPTTTSLRTETLVENLDISWDLSFAADGTLFISERVGRLRRYEDGEVTTISAPSQAIDAATGEDSWYVQGGEGGTLGVAAHPGFPDPPLVYVYYTYTDLGSTYNRVEAFDVSASNPNRASEVVVDRIPGDAYHNGGRIAFGPEGNLWITCGEALKKSRAQNRSSLGGKVLRVTPSGLAAPGNHAPEDGDPRVFTFGHRNPQCITWTPDATPIAAEHGPNGMDEVQRLVSGDNYGWPDTRKPQAYPDAPGVHPPLANSFPNSSWAPSGGVFYTGDGVPSLSNRLLIGCLIGQQLLVVTLTPPDGEVPPVGDGHRYNGDWTDQAYTATVHTMLEDELGRIRHVEQGPDGDLYAVTSNRDGRAKDPFPVEGDDRLVRITTA